MVNVSPPTVRSLVTVISRLTRLALRTTSPLVVPPPNCTFTEPAPGTVTEVPPVIVNVWVAAVYVKFRPSAVNVRPPTSRLLSMVMSRLTKLPFWTTSPWVSWLPNCTSTVLAPGTVTRAPPVIVNVWVAAV